MGVFKRQAILKNNIKDPGMSISFGHEDLRMSADSLVQFLSDIEMIYLACA